MSREIKFRAWDGKQMYLSGGDLRYLGSWFDAHLPGALADCDRVAVMQYTGLKDANGVEIYEGDILRHPLFYETPEMACNPPMHSAVIFENGCFTFKDSDSLYYELEAYDGQMEVVGNIHENPELLEAQR